jgi:hypothetical protein
MDSFYEVLDLLYKLNKKYPIYTFGQLMELIHNKNVESLDDLSNDNIALRLKLILEDE